MFRTLFAFLVVSFGGVAFAQNQSAIIHFDPSQDAGKYLIQVFKSDDPAVPEYLRVVQQVSADPNNVIDVPVFENGTSNHELVSTAGIYGGHQFLTPAGNYEFDRLDADHHSSEYHQAPMPWSMFFEGGIAIHGIPADEFTRLGQPASHGCVRMRPENAQALFQFVQAHGTASFVVQVIDPVPVTPATTSAPAVAAGN